MYYQVSRHSLENTSKQNMRSVLKLEGLIPKQQNFESWTKRNLKFLNHFEFRGNQQSRCPDGMGNATLAPPRNGCVHGGKKLPLTLCGSYVGLLDALLGQSNLSLKFPYKREIIVRGDKRVRHIDNVHTQSSLHACGPSS